MMIETANKLLREATAAFTQGDDAYAKGVLAALDIIEGDRKAEWERTLSMLSFAAPDPLPEPEPEPERLKGAYGGVTWYRTVGGEYDCECCTFDSTRSFSSLVDEYDEIVSVPLPERVTDHEDDEWTLNPNGLYEYGTFTPRSYATLWDDFGPLAVGVGSG